MLQQGGLQYGLVSACTDACSDCTVCSDTVSYCVQGFARDMALLGVDPSVQHVVKQQHNYQLKHIVQSSYPFCIISGGTACTTCFHTQPMTISTCSGMRHGRLRCAADYVSVAMQTQHGLACQSS